MIKTNFILALRSLMNHKKYAFINIFGLAIGLSCFILIILWVQDEFSYDKFHEDVDNVHIVFRKQDEKCAAVSSKLLAPSIKSEIPEIAEATCFMKLPESFNSRFQYEEQSFVENFALADKHFFDVFSFPLLQGDPTTVFSHPNSVLLSKRMSQKYFGEEDPMGKSLSVIAFGQKKLLRVTGVIENIPHNSHIQSELILPIEFMDAYGMKWDVWHNQAPTTYIRTYNQISTVQLEEKILSCKQGHFPEENVSYSVLPITKIHLNTSNVSYFTSTGDIKYVYVFSAIAAIILLIACMNYMNLSNALSLKRSKEIGVKKALGSTRLQIILQYFGETFMLVFIAFLISIVMVQVSLPVLNDLVSKSLFVPYSSPQYIFALLGITLVTSLISGIYPALFVSAFKPIHVLKGKFLSSPKSANVRKGLVIFQFVLSIIIVIGTITISNQLKFIQNTNMGYDKEHIVCIQTQGDVSNNYETFKNEILSSGHVLNITRSANMDVDGMGRTSGIDWPGKQEQFQMWVLYVDDQYAKTYGITIDDGRFYSRDFPSDFTNGFVINQTAADQMGVETPIGHDLTVWGRKGTIIGITDDFHFNTLHNKIEPLLLLIPDPENVNSRCPAVSMKIKPNSFPQSLDYIEKSWKSHFLDETFDYFFIDDQLAVSYEPEYRMGTLFKYFSFLVIFIACLGLYGLMAFMIEQKSKQIGVYKVIGASISDVMMLFSKSYMFWILIALIIATPIAYYAMSKWLENFAYKTELSWWIFALAGVLTLCIALLTVSFQSWKAARRNPIESLRYE